jgi:hypothetical protein
VRESAYKGAACFLFALCKGNDIVDSDATVHPSKIDCLPIGFGIGADEPVSLTHEASLLRAFLTFSSMPSMVTESQIWSNALFTRLLDVNSA